jgi:hypothetical protein
MADWSDLKRCIDLTEAQCARAAASPAAMHGLLSRAAEIARPEQGAAKVLLALARLATAQCRWVEGTLRVEITVDGAGSALSVIFDLGGGVREKAFPTTRLQVPVVEFTRAVRRVPHLVAPLVVTHKQGMLVLSASPAARQASLAPPIYEIDDQSLRRSLMPPPRRSSAAPAKGAPEARAPSKAAPDAPPAPRVRPAAPRPPAVRLARKSGRPRSGGGA